MPLIGPQCAIKTHFAIAAANCSKMMRVGSGRRCASTRVCIFFSGHCNRQSATMFMCVNACIFSICCCVCRGWWRNNDFSSIWIVATINDLSSLSRFVDSLSSLIPNDFDLNFTRVLTQYFQLSMRLRTKCATVQAMLSAASPNIDSCHTTAINIVVCATVAAALAAIFFFHRCFCDPLRLYRSLCVSFLFSSISTAPVIIIM